MGANWEGLGDIGSGELGFLGQAESGEVFRTRHPKEPAPPKPWKVQRAALDSVLGGKLTCDGCSSHGGNHPKAEALGW